MIYVLANHFLIMLEDAIKLAEHLHKGQYRKTWEEYINHPLAVMRILSKYDFPEEALICAILHDICEDTEATNVQIRELFWDRVGFIINALTKNQKPKNNKELKEIYEKQKLNSEYKTFEEYVDYRFHLYINRFTIWIIADPWIMYIKMADQMHNLQTVDVFTSEKRARKIAELENFFIPMYERMTGILTPMYLEKYENMMWDLKSLIKEKKAL